MEDFMFFNEFLWNNFKESQHGQRTILFFLNYKDNIFQMKNVDLYSRIIDSINYDTREEIDFKNYFESIKSFCDETSKALSTDDISEVITIEDAENLYYSIIDENNDIQFDVDDIPFLSECLYILYPQFYFPYYFRGYYYHLVSIFNEFGIYLPPVPHKNDIKKRLFHYFELCKSLYEFRKNKKIEAYELPAFLYGFATGVIKKYEITDVLPEPRNAYFVGGGKNNNGDFEYLDDVNNNTITYWNGNRDTQPGDIIVMYCLTPRSCIHSIWRAVTPGSFDPFFAYYGTIYIGKPLLVKPISIDEIKNDKILSELPLVKGNMQGINGRIIPKKYYDRIIEILKTKGEDISLLPTLADNIIQNIDLKNEKDVEKYLLEPLLKKLGFSEPNWKKQLKLRMGRGEKVFPDYVIFPKEERNNESGFWVWEAKYSIINNKQLKEDFGQAKSYALRLNCKGLGLISKEGVWISTQDFSFEKIKFWSWSQIKEHGYFNEIFNIAGLKKKN
jgi:hypothetical protein